MGQRAKISVGMNGDDDEAQVWDGTLGLWEDGMLELGDGMKELEDDM